MQLNIESDEEAISHNLGYQHNPVYYNKPKPDFAKLSLGSKNTGTAYANWLNEAITPHPISKISVGEKIRNVRLLKSLDKSNSLSVITPRLNILGNRNFTNSKQKAKAIRKVKLSLKSLNTDQELTKKIKFKKNHKTLNNHSNRSKKEHNLKKLSLSNYPCGDKKINGADNQLSPKLTLPDEIITNTCESKRKYDEDNNILIITKRDKENRQAESYSDKKLKLVEQTENMSVYDYHRPQQQMDTGSNMVGITGNGGLSGGFNMTTAKPYIHLTADEDELNHQGNSGNLPYYHNSQLSMSTLCNIGNTCYLNSVIYTLRFAPLFLHNLHHLIDDLNQINLKLGQNRTKSSSLGRNVAGLSGQNARSFSSKDLVSLGNNLGCDVPKTNRQIATEKLHELFQNLHRNEITDNTEPFHADTFLQAIQAVSAIFEGNNQQDAHEFLMCILDSIRETCESLTKIISDSPDIIVNGYVSVPEQSEITLSPPTSKPSFFSRKSKKKEEKSKFFKPPDSPLKENIQHNNDLTELDGDEAGSLNKVVAPTANDNEKVIEKIKKLGLDFFTEDFVGATISTTKCLTCETITEQKEPMIDIAVPISGYENMEKMDNPHLFFQNSCITKESFRGENKYRCEKCFGYTEAIRSISFEKLPRLLVIQLKRFSGGMEKINSYIPTPLQIDCFCVKCLNSGDNKKRHVYRLYSIITHVGATMSVGHYIAYTCSLDFYTEYLNCPKDKKNHLNRSQSNSSKHGESGNSSSEKNTKKIITYFLRSKASSSGDVTKNLKNLNLNGVMSKFTNGGISSNTNVDKITNSSLAVASTPNPTMCSGLSCCGIHAESILLRNNGHNLVNGGSLLNNDISDKDNTSNNYNSDSHHQYNYHYHPSATNTRHGEPTWYMCDDDKIKSMTQTEFEELLSPNNKATITPYLLFYARINTD